MIGPLEDKLVVGVRNTMLRNKLSQTADLTLSKCIDMCALSEFRDQLEPMGDNIVVREVDFVTKATSECAGGQHVPNTGLCAPAWRNSTGLASATVKIQCRNCDHELLRGSPMLSAENCQTFGI